MALALRNSDYQAASILLSNGGYVRDETEPIEHLAAEAT